MLDWLRRDPRAAPTIEIAGRSLPIEVRRLDRARRMTMRLAPDGSTVRISMPRWGGTAEALAFARSRRDWLERQLVALPAPVTVQSGSPLMLLGRPIELRHQATSRRRPILEDGVLHVGGAEASLAPRLRRWLQERAVEHITRDLGHYCARAGVSVPRLALSNARRRWGSCAADGAIRINWRLIMAPEFVRRSVVAHEVAHLLHFDHSPAFHASLASLFEGDLGAANAWLKREGRGLYQPFG
jgi:predicted metal-dependent hydrolase